MYNITMTNKELIKKYPFLRIRNAMTGKITRGYKQTYLDWMPGGWRFAFSDLLVDEISRALGKQAKHYRIMDIKEKFGGLRWYDENGNEETYRIVFRYEQLSKLVCIRCGAKATKISKGWISPYCDKCANDMNGGNKADWELVDFVPIKEYYDLDKEED